MRNAAYLHRRTELETYFDRTASEAWAKLTSDAPVSGIRATVRAGRDQMRAALLSALPEDLTGARMLDAGCGPGQLAIEAARRGAEVIAVDLSPTLLDLARERAAGETFRGRITFAPGDMLDPAHGNVDFAVAMDSLIHYPAAEIAASLEALAPRVAQSIVFTFAPKTMLLTLMHQAGALFPRGDKAPAIEPVSETKLRRLIGQSEILEPFAALPSAEVSSGFYISRAMELARR
ncbi:MAG: magnesium protoporphyrin IX methyltransferase [Parvularcula sp.]|jgi:magnesium-protoporphyrin O-methyltransferase|nr:magnesium protoporphyrin IX methyltransferase [Parvularcula sp.]